MKHQDDTNDLKLQHPFFYYFFPVQKASAVCWVVFILLMWATPWELLYQLPWYRLFADYLYDLIPAISGVGDNSYNPSWTLAFMPFIYTLGFIFLVLSVIFCRPSQQPNYGGLTIKKSLFGCIFMISIILLISSLLFYIEIPTARESLGRRNVGRWLYEPTSTLFMLTFIWMCFICMVYTFSVLIYTLIRMLIQKR